MVFVAFYVYDKWEIEIDSLLAKLSSSSLMVKSEIINKFKKH